MIYVIFLILEIIQPALKVQIILLLNKKINVIVKYLQFINIFSKKLLIKLPKYSNIYEYFFDMEKSKWLPCKLIYSITLIKFQIFKTQIEANLTNKLIQLFKSLTKSSILSLEKLYTSIYLYVNFQSENNLTIQNQYILLPITEPLH